MMAKLINYWVNFSLAYCLVSTGVGMAWAIYYLAREVFP